MIISPQDFVRLPVHDSQIREFTIEPKRDGFCTVSLKINIHPDEILDLAKELGIKGPGVCVVFQNCWQTKTNVFGYSSSPETVSAFDIEAESGLIQRLLSFGLGNKRMIHFKITGAGGSQFDIIAEGVSLTELPTLNK